MGDKREQFKGGQVGKIRPNSSPSGWFPPRNLSGKATPKASGAEPHGYGIPSAPASATGRMLRSLKKAMGGGD